jgi:hypothetical protein
MKKPLAVFSIIQHETVWPRLWVNHYARELAPADIYLIDHDSNAAAAEALERLRQTHGITVLRVHHPMTHWAWLASTASKFQHFLLMSYRAVLYADIDEFVFVAPREQRQTLSAYAAEHMSDRDRIVRCKGFEVVHNRETEPPIDFGRPLLQQRRHWYHTRLYSKPVLANVAMNWREGFHKAEGFGMDRPIDDDVWLVHMHKIDFDYAMNRHREMIRRRWSDNEIRHGLGIQNRIVDKNELAQWFSSSVDHAPLVLTEIPEDVRTLI